MSHPDLLFRAMPLLRALPAETLASLPVARVERQAGEAFFQQGDPGDSAWGVVTGRVKIVKQSPRGRDVILEVVGPGEVFAAIAVLRGVPMPATAVALEAAACVRIPGPAFKEAVTSHPEVSAKLLETVSKRLLDANASRLGLATEPVEVRLARSLIRMAGKFGVRRTGEIVFTQAFTRQNLADLSGTTVETSIRIMSRWTRDGLVRSDASRLTILRPQVLEQIAQGGEMCEGCGGCD